MPNASSVYRGVPNVAAKVSGYPFPPAVNLLVLRTPITSVCGFSALVDTKSLMRVGSARRINGPHAYEKLLGILQTLDPNIKEYSDYEPFTLMDRNTGSKMQIVFDLSEKCFAEKIVMWYPLTLVIQDTFITIYEFPIGPLESVA